MYLKITNLEELHHGLQYHDGLVIDPVPFEREGTCCPGGIYFTTPEFICNFLNYGPWIREVTIPEDAEMVQDPEGDKWRASKVILSSRKDLREVETWKWLIECGIDIHDDNEYVVRYSAAVGYLEVVKYLVEKGTNIHVNNDEMLRWSAQNGYLEIVKFLIDKGANIHANNDCILRYTTQNVYLEVVKYLVEKGADIHANNDEALQCAAQNGYLKVVEYLKNYG
jgi:hypothetical protein